MEWVISVRLEDSAENKRKVSLLIKHAFLKYSGVDGTMKEETTSEFLRFLMNYYYNREIGGK